MLLEHVDLSLREHAPIADQYDSRQSKPLGERLDLIGDGLGITGVAGIDLDSNGPPLGVGERAVDDDRQTGLAVAVVAEAGQWASLALVVAAGHVVEHHRPVAQVPFGQLVLDHRLSFQQPVHGVVELILGGVGDVQLLGQCGVVPVSRVGQLGAGEDQPFDDHGDDEMASVRGLGGDEVVEAERLDHLEDGLDVAVGERSRDADGVGGGDEGLALERASDQVDEVIGQMGEVAEGLVSDGLPLADGPPEQMGEVGLSLIDPLGRGHMYGAGSGWHVPIFGEPPVVSSKFLDF